MPSSSSNLIKTEVLHLPEKFFAGLSLHVPEQNEDTSAQIGQLWQRFFTEDIINQIPSKKGPEIYGVYTDVTLSDNNLSYNITTAFEVEHNTNLKNLTTIHLPAQTYLKFTSPQGPMPQVCVETWQFIWNYFSNPQSPHARSYTGSFELYDHRAQDPQNTQLDIFISIKS